MAIDNKLYSHCNAQKHETFRLNIRDEGAFVVFSPNIIIGVHVPRILMPVLLPIESGLKS